jgi:hypothetical protein
MFQHGETGRMSFVSNDGMNNPELFLKMNPRYALVCALVTPPAAQRQPLTAEAIRAAGGIVHKDGNVFFTNLEQLNQAIRART